MLESLLNSETQRIIALIHKHNLTLQPFIISNVIATNDFKYQAMIKVLDTNNRIIKFNIIVGNELINIKPIGLCIAVICHELGHIVNVTGEFLFRNAKKFTYSSKGLNYYYKGAEFLADILAVKFLALSGYNPHIYIDYFQEFQRIYNIDPNEEDERHPSINRRINTITKLINSRF